MTSASRPPERIAVGIDGSLCSHAAVRWAIDHAQPGDTINLVYAWRASPSMVGTGLVDPTDDTAATGFADHELARARALPVTRRSRCAARSCTATPRTASPTTQPTFSSSAPAGTAASPACSSDQ